MKARDHAALGRFWADALGWGVSSEGPGVTNVEPVGFVWPDPAAVCVDVVSVPDPETVKYRVHLDLATTSAAHQAALVARLQELGATPADVGQGDVPWTVLADPEGNLFCVLEPRELYRDTSPIAAVVVDCADPRAMARFWGEAMDWTLHEVTDDHARLRSAKGVGPYLEFLRGPGVRTWWNRIHLDPGAVPGGRSGGRGGSAAGAAPPMPTSVRETCRGRFWPIRRGTSSACWVGAEHDRGPGWDVSARHTRRPAWVDSGGNAGAGKRAATVFQRFPLRSVGRGSCSYLDGAFLLRHRRQTHPAFA